LRLQKDFDLSVSEISLKEQASLKNVNLLRDVLTRRLTSASEGVREHILEVSKSGCQNIMNSSASAAPELMTWELVSVSRCYSLLMNLPEARKGLPQHMPKKPSLCNKRTG